MATHGTWHRQGFAVVAAATVFGSLTVWATQLANRDTGVRCDSHGVPVLCRRRYQSPGCFGCIYGESFIASLGWLVSPCRR